MSKAQVVERPPGFSFDAQPSESPTGASHEASTVTAFGIPEAAQYAFKFLKAPLTFGEPYPNLVVGPDDNFYYTGPEGANYTPSVVQLQPASGRNVVFGPTQQILEYTQSFAGAVLGPDGNIWLGVYDNCAVASMTTEGSFTAHKIDFGRVPPQEACAGSTIVGAVAGSQVWFTGARGGKYYVGYFDVATKKDRIFMLKNIGGANMNNIVLGSDGNLWFGYGLYVGRVTPEGAVTLFDPHVNVGYINQVLSGPDGNIWFNFGTTSGISSIGILDTQGGSVGVISNSTGTFGLMTNGPDGDVWVSGESSGLYKISTKTLKYMYYLFPKAEALQVAPLSIVTGPDGNLWFNTTDRESGSNTKGIGIGKFVR